MMILLPINIKQNPEPSKRTAGYEALSHTEHTYKLRRLFLIARMPNMLSSAIRCRARPGSREGSDLDARLRILRWEFIILETYLGIISNVSPFPDLSGK